MLGYKVTNAFVNLQYVIVFYVRLEHISTHLLKTTQAPGEGACGVLAGEFS